MESLGLMPAPVDLDFWHGKRVLLTGHTGFKGGWMALWLTSMGARVSGLALPMDTSPSFYALAKVADVVPGNIVTEYKRGKPAMRIEGAGRSYSPFTRQVR